MGGKRGKGGLTAVPSDATPPTGSLTDDTRAVYYGERLVQFVASGVPLAQAARSLDVPLTSAHRYYEQALAAVPGLTDAEKRDQLRLDLETIRLLIQAHMPRAMGTPARDGRAAVPPQPSSGSLILTALARRARLLGMDSALQVSISNTAITDAVEDIAAMLHDRAPLELPPLPSLPPLPTEQGTA